MNIPLVDLHAQYLSIKNEIDTAIQRIIAQSAYIGGAAVRDFENAYAADYGVKHCVSVANGTESSWLVSPPSECAAGWVCRNPRSPWRSATRWPPAPR